MMNTVLKLAAFSSLTAASLALCAPLAARSETAISGLDRAAPEQAGRAQPPRLIAFEGEEELGNTAARLGIMTQAMEFNIAVGPDGAATDCAMTRRFRSATVPRQLCDVVLRDARFAPAVDAAGNAASGTYRGQIAFRSLITRER